MGHVPELFVALGRLEQADLPAVFRIVHDRDASRMQINRDESALSLQRTLGL
jgi:hypothetical protein